MSTIHRRKHMKRWSLLVSGALCLVFLAQAPSAAASGPTLVHVIDTSQWEPPSPDPSGITYWPAKNTLVVSDAEVDEMPIFANANIFESSLTGTLQRTYNIKSFNNEPAGIDIDVAPNGHFFISNDGKQKIFDIDLGPDGKFATSDDVIRSFSTTTFGDNDPEGLSLGQIGGQTRLFVTDGAGSRIHVLDPGPNGRFDGGGDDIATSFDVGSIGIKDPEGIDYYPTSGTLYVVDRSRRRVSEITTGGGFIRMIDLSPWNVVNPGDLTLAPGSNNASETHLYVAARGVDNNTDPNENDGKIYEITLGDGQDTTPPHVTSRVPAPGATNVNVAANVTATFDEAMNGATITSSSFTLTGPGGAVAAAVTYDTTTKTATLNPNANLAPSAGYTAQLTGAITDQAGNALASAPVTWSFTTAAGASGNLLVNPGFEIDNNQDNKPDTWSSNAQFTRSTGDAGVTPHLGAAMGRFFATDDTGATIKQKVTNLSATTYQYSAWVNIPDTTDTFTFKLQVKWLNASGSTISTSVVKTYKADTNGVWEQTTASLTAPAGTTAAQVLMVTSSLNLTVFVDDLDLHQ